MGSILQVRLSGTLPSCSNKSQKLSICWGEYRCWVNGGVSPEIPDLAALGYPPRQDERGQMTVGWQGGDVHVPCDLLSLLMLRHAGVGVGGDVNVPSDLLTLLMLRHAGVGVVGGC